MRIELTAAALRSYLIDQLLPFWVQHGQDPEHQGWHLFLEPDFTPSSESDFRRVVVQARQLYSLSLVHRIQAVPWLNDAIEVSLAHLVDRFRDAEHGGWFFTLQPDGTILDAGKDTYAHAFVLLALVTCYRATGSSAALQHAEETFEIIQSRLRHDEGGFVEGRQRDWSALDPAPPRRQNSHMHVLEAFCAFFEATGRREGLSGCKEIVELLWSQFYDAETASLGEHFDEDWTPLADARGEEVEPGHHFEWIWLLFRYAKLSGDDNALGSVDEMYRRALEFGLTASDCSVLDKINRRGEVIDAKQRVWPQTEFLKALAVRWEVQGDLDARQRMESVFQYCVKQRIDPSTGAWREQLAADGSVIDARYFASSVYHIVLAIAELIRVLESVVDSDC